MLNGKFQPRETAEHLFDFSGGINAGLNPLLLPRNTLASANNVTVRGSFATHRPPFRKMTLQFTGDIKTAVEKGRFQAACFYKPAAGNSFLRAAIGGRLFEFNPAVDTCSVVERSTLTTRQDPTARQHWIWQSEK